MTPNVTIVLLVCCVSMVLGASVNKQNNIQKTPRDTRHASRTTIPIVKRSSNALTFETEAVGLDLQRNGNPVLVSTIKRRKEAFQGSASDDTFDEKMESIYEMRQQKWELQKDVVVNSSSCDTEKIKNSDNADLLYENVIELYTREHDCIYRGVNMALREYRTQADSELGSFALMLNVVLTKWTSLSKYTKTTYRGVSENVTIEQYTVGTTFTWTGFTSSSKDEDKACEFAETALFIFDNSADSEWRPRGIKEYSAIPKEEEYLYPATAIFKVSVKQGACGDSDIKSIYISLQRGNNQARAGTLSAGWTVKGTTVLVVIAAVVVIFV